jgi:DNA polymerase-3 subunit gamma/tau
VSYLVLARKYRPTTFDEIVGQEHVVRTLSNAIKLDRVHHAFLFTGARGVCKTTTARVLAKALNCENGPTSTPCDQCTACKEITAGNSPDVLEIDGASNTGVDNVRELRENVRYLPSQGKFKLYIIDEVHMLSTAAFNALLKTLEEPPAHVKFIFATTEPQKIPVTILSRCQRFDFRRVSLTALMDHLKDILAKENISVGAAGLLAIAREAQGSVRDAMSLLDQVLSYAGTEPKDSDVVEALGVVDRQTIFDLIDSVIARDAQALLDLIGEIDSRGHDLADVAGLVVEHLRDLMVVKVVEGSNKSLPERSQGEFDSLKGQADARSKADIHRLFTLMVAVADDVSRSNVARISLEMGLLRLLELEPQESLENILTKLDGLISGGGIGGVVKASAPTSQEPKVEQALAKAAAPDISSDDIREAGTTMTSTGWTRFVERVRGVRPALASVLEHGRPIKFGPDGVEIGYVEGTFYWESARETENREQIIKVLGDHFAQPVVLSFSTINEEQKKSASLAQVDQQKAEDRYAEIKESAMGHPAVQGAVSILGGEVKEVVSLEKEQ